MKVEFYKFSKKMIRISRKLMTNTILHFLNPDYHIPKQEYTAINLLPNLSELRPPFAGLMTEERDLHQ